MLVLSIFLEGDDAFTDWIDREKIHLANTATPIRVAALSGGMTSGKPSVAIGIELPDGRVVVAETSMRLFLTAAKAFEARYQEELGDA